MSGQDIPNLNSLSQLKLFSRPVTGNSGGVQTNLLDCDGTLARYQCEVEAFNQGKGYSRKKAAAIIVEPQSESELDAGATSAKELRRLEKEAGKENKDRKKEAQKDHGQVWVNQQRSYKAAAHAGEPDNEDTASETSDLDANSGDD
eukprot:1633383-Rhodomonas_salina.1